MVPFHGGGEGDGAVLRQKIVIQKRLLHSESGNCSSCKRRSCKHMVAPFVWTNLMGNCGATNSVFPLRKAFFSMRCDRPDDSFATRGPTPVRKGRFTLPNLTTVDFELVLEIIASILGGAAFAQMQPLRAQDQCIIGPWRHRWDTVWILDCFVV